MEAERELVPRKQPRQERARGTVEAILDGAAQVFSVKGYAAGTTNHIAERAGVSIGSLYRYFPNKDAILMELLGRRVKEGLRLVEEALSEVSDPMLEPEGALRRFVEALIGFHRGDPELHRVLFDEGTLPQSLRRSLGDFEESIAEKVELLLGNSLGVRVKNIGLASRIIVQTVESLAHRFAIRSPRELDGGEFIDEVVNMLGRYLFY